ncbi:MAG: thioredoxin family protein [Phycisphaerae bacterium]|nr:thioredoxin family protein [Phycisphaerae bacterium]
MKTKLFILFITTSLVTFTLPVFAEVKTEDQPKIVADLYPGLTSGAMSYASLKALPENILLQAEAIQFTQEEFDKIVASQPEAAREELKKNAFFILEQEATNRLLLQLAKKTLTRSGKDISGQKDAAIIQKYFETAVFKTIKVTDKEIKTFYENNKDMCGGATLEQISSSLKEYLVSQKKQQIITDHIRDLGKQIPIQISESWVKEKATLAFDNPVDKARKSKKPSMVDFGASGCRPCDMMTPILETLSKKYEGKASVIFIHVREQKILASRYGIQSIPTQIFYDKEGKEVYRHTGFFPQEEIEKKLKEIGVQ